MGFEGVQHSRREYHDAIPVVVLFDVGLVNVLACVVELLPGKKVSAPTIKTDNPRIRQVPTFFIFSVSLLKAHVPKAPGAWPGTHDPHPWQHNSEGYVVVLFVTAVRVSLVLALNGFCHRLSRLRLWLTAIAATCYKPANRLIDKLATVATW